MTEHNVELLRGRETQSRMLVRLGAVCLAVLLFLSLFLVGGSFSKYISEGTIWEIPLPTVAKFDVQVVENEDFDPDYGYNQVVLCAFDVSNNSQVDITFDMVLNLTITITFTNRDRIGNLKFTLLNDEAGDEELGFDLKDNHGEISAEYEYEATDLFLQQDGITTFSLMVDYNDAGYFSQEGVGIVVSGNFTITRITQVSGEIW